MSLQIRTGFWGVCGGLTLWQLSHWLGTVDLASESGTRTPEPLGSL